jgi:hypothetical protein
MLVHRTRFARCWAQAGGDVVGAAQRLTVPRGGVRLRSLNGSSCPQTGPNRGDRRAAEMGGLRNFPICVAVAASAPIPDVPITTTR